MIEELIGIEHKVYQLEYIEANIHGRRLSDSDKFKLLDECDSFVSECLSLFPKANDPEQFLIDNDITYIEDKDAVNTEHYVEFAYFMKPNIISINKHIFEDVFYRSDVKECISLDNAMKLLLQHEIFHFLEYKYAKELKSLKSDKYEFINKRRYRSLCSELLAMNYAYIVTGEKYSPYILNVLLVLNTNPDLAKKNYNKIKEANDKYRGEAQ